VDGYASSCNRAEKTYSIPFNWENGKYKLQIEREASENGKYIKEIVGRAYFTVI